MTAITTNNAAPSVASFETLYAKMLPHFQYFAKRVRRRKGVDIEDVMQELAGWALLNYTSLVKAGKDIFYTPILKFAIKRYREGRRFTGSSTTDILSEQTQKLGRSKVYTFSQFVEEETTESWFFMRDRKTNVADSVQFKIDFEDWHYRQSPRDQQIIDDLMMSETTNAVAKKYSVSPALISIKRKQFAHSWKTFIDPPEAGMLVPA